MQLGCTDFVDGDYQLTVDFETRAYEELYIYRVSALHPCHSLIKMTELVRVYQIKHTLLTETPFQLVVPVMAALCNAIAVCSVSLTIFWIVYYRDLEDTGRCQSFEQHEYM